ncbi:MULTISPECIES: BolA family protein [Aromatoleum]|uniref:BolA/IbaG family iron-sulfur metabolism protein n=2 Tax=Aromatoleum TaxID=551759 RepID=A0ABX1NQE3_9RHOO|nr:MULTISPECIES: BolA family protein [Aromatoleum]MCK0507658.1 BolA family transcriptional regulator [Aromatoleum anaerobium]NMG14204.1 BolA/IbaG family iron-sulfur metabolism protein [Aromatoleum bremense]QTQ33985.1 BolA family protein [Aromatoleum bremense]
MTTIDQIRERLAVLDPVSIEIDDDSALHAGHAGARSGGGHYRLTIVAECFKGKNTVARHRLVYDALGDLMRTRVHALAVRALTADEA